MEQPEHDLRAHAPTVMETSGQRGVSLLVVVGIHIGLGFALIAGLQSGMLDKLPEELKAEVVQPKDDVKPPPPPPPDLAKPPPPFVPPPEIVIQQAAPAPTITTVLHKEETKPLISSPVGIGRAHSCSPAKYYSETAIRLKEQGTTTLSFTI